MAKPEWGIKRTCLNCEAHFYDLRRNPIRCPKCNSSFIEPEVSFRTQRPVATRKMVKPIMATKTVEELDMNLPESDKSEVTLAGIHEDGAIESEDDAEALRGEDDDEAGDALIEDASDLCADDDDMAEVIERLGEDRDV